MLEEASAVLQSQLQSHLPQFEHVRRPSQARGMRLEERRLSLTKPSGIPRKRACNEIHLLGGRARVSQVRLARSIADAALPNLRAALPPPTTQENRTPAGSVKPSRVARRPHDAAKCAIRRRSEAVEAAGPPPDRAISPAVSMVGGSARPAREPTTCSRSPGPRGCSPTMRGTCCSRPAP